MNREWRWMFCCYGALMLNGVLHWLCFHYSDKIEKVAYVVLQAFPIYISGVLIFFFWFLGVGWDWVHLVRRKLTGLLYHPRMIDDDCGAVGGMRIGRGNRSTRRKPASVPLCPPRIAHDLGSNPGHRDGSRRLTAWAMSRPYSIKFISDI
jgi:hypothetical protein